jgi:hypothetical protein
MSGEADFRAGAGDLRSETANASTEIRWVDGHAYMRFDAPASKGASPTALFPDLRGKWLTLDDSNDAGATSAGTVSNMFRPDFLLDVFRSASRSIRTVGHDTIRGVATTHLRIVVDGPALKKVLAAKGVPANETTTSTQSLDVWVDSRGRLRRITGVDAGSDPATTTQMDFYDYGVRVDVQPPPANEITDFPNSDQLATSSATSAPPSP